MRRLAIILLAAAAGVSLMASQAGAVDRPNSDRAPVETTPEVLAPVDVVQVSGLIDEILIDEISVAINDAEANGSQALILQTNSDGAVVGRDRMADLVELIHNSPVPIGIWVGPSGADLTGLGMQMMAAADVTAMAPGSHIGQMGTPLTVDGVTFDFGTATDRLRTEVLGFQDARQNGALKLDITDEGVPSIKNMVLALDNLSIDGTTLHTVSESLTDTGSTQINSTLVRFTKLGLLNQLLHTVSSPAVAYLLFIIGLVLLLFEFYTAGVGVAGVVGAVCLLLSCYGLAALPTRGWAVAAILLSMFAFAIDVQVGIPRLWTGIGLVSFILGSWFLFRDVLGSDLRPSWITLLVGVGGIALTFVVGMPSMVRTRFATPTVGREWMIGEIGTAVSTIDPEGLAEVGGGRWRARVNRATPLQSGDVLRVVAIDGVTLEVEPEEGGAKDYREMRGKKASTADPDIAPGDVSVEGVSAEGVNSN
ncbi:MAG: NfeD family protein [Ilumatobacteraceae bacterium]